MRTQNAPERRRKRSTEEVERLILDAAERLFGENGYQGTTTREIARAAGVAEPMVFRAFGSKERLFEASVLEPFTSFMDGYTRQWSDPASLPGRPEDALAQFAEGLYDTVVEHRGLFAALLSTSQLGDKLQPTLGLLERVSDAVAQANGLSWDTPVAARAAVVMVVGMALSEDEIYGANPAPDRDRIVAELTRMLVGAAGLPVPGEVGRFNRAARKIARPAL